MNRVVFKHLFDFYLWLPNIRNLAEFLNFVLKPTLLCKFHVHLNNC